MNNTKIENSIDEIVKLVFVILDNNHIEYDNVYLVGGIVRSLLKNEDIYFNTIPVDVDIVLRWYEGCKIDYKLFNSRFFTFTITKDKFNFTFSYTRKESYEGIKCSTTYRLTDNLFYDSLRRDFTYNCIYLKINRDIILKNIKYLDLVNGIDDLKNNCLQLIDSNSFLIDPSRIVRFYYFFLINRSVISNEIKSILNYLKHYYKFNRSTEHLKYRIKKEFATRSNKLTLLQKQVFRNFLKDFFSFLT